MSNSDAIDRLAKFDVRPYTLGLSTEESEIVEGILDRLVQDQTQQVQSLFDFCNTSFQYAKTHSSLLKDWEKAREQMHASNSSFLSLKGHQSLISGCDDIMSAKLKAVRETFEEKFGESIFNFLGPDGKTKKLFGLFG